MDSYDRRRVSSSFAKFMTEDEMNAILKKTGAEKGDVILIVADKIKNHVLTVLGALRQKVAKKLDIIPRKIQFPVDYRVPVL